MKTTPRLQPRLRPLLAAALPVLLVGTGGAGCRPDFAPYNRVTSLRVLAIQSEPPAPGPGEQATFTALIYAPPGFPAPTYSWSWCPDPAPAAEGYRCLVTESELTAMFPIEIPPFDLGTGATATLSNSIDPAVLAALCRGTPGVPQIADCTYGFPFQVGLTVQTGGDGDPAHEDKVQAVVTGHWRFDAAMPPNTNPSIEALTATRMGEPTQPIADPPVVTLSRDDATPIGAVVPETAVESYDGVDDDGNPKLLRERLFLTWFVEGGGTDDSRTSFSATSNGDAAEDMRRFADLQKNTWNPGPRKDYPPDTARLYGVIHDNRGGVSWKSGTVNLEPTP